MTATNTDTPAVAWYWTDCGIEFFAREGQPRPHHAEPLYRLGIDREAVKAALRGYRPGGASINETADAILSLIGESRGA